MERRQARPLTRIPTLRFRVTYMEGRILTNEQYDVLLLPYLRAGDTANSNTYQFYTSVSLSFVRYGSARSLGFLNGFRYPQVPCIGYRTAHPSPQCPCIRVCGVLASVFTAERWRRALAARGLLRRHQRRRVGGVLQEYPNAQVLLVGRRQRRQRRCIESMCGLLQCDGTYDINKMIWARVRLSESFLRLNGQAYQCAPRACLPTIFMGHQRGGGAAEAISN